MYFLSCRSCADFPHLDGCGRFQEIPHEGAFGDIVWSDPEDIESWAAKASMIRLCLQGCMFVE